MPYKRLSTAKIAKVMGCHPNTVRMYEQIGFIAPVPRSPKGYRLYTEAHLEQMRLARLAMEGAYPGPNIRRSLLALIHQAASTDYSGALEMARRHVSVVRLEREQAETAATFLEEWARGETVSESGPALRIQQAAHALLLTPDTLRNWERSGFIRVPRSPQNGYRQYGPLQLGRLRVIRLLRQAGYSAMSILRMLVQFDQGASANLRQALDTPRPDEDVYTAPDRWLSTLAYEEERAMKIIALLEEMSSRWGHSVT